MRRAITKTAGPGRDRGAAAPPVPRPPSAPPLPLPHEVSALLRRVRAARVRVRLAEGVLWFLTLFPALALCQGLADWTFNLPRPARIVLLAGDAAAVAALAYVFVVQPWRRRLTPWAAALLVEREVPELRSALISAVELAAAPPRPEQASPALVRQLIAAVLAQVRREALLPRVVRTAHLKRPARWAALACALLAGTVTLVPGQAAVLARRILLDRVPLPTRTVVVPITREETVSVGRDLTLSARAQGVVPRHGRVKIVFTNGDRTGIDVDPQMDQPDVFTLGFHNVQQGFTYQFALNDGVGEEYAVAAVVPPTLATCRFVQSFPDYTGRKPQEMAPGNLVLLVGSRVRVEGQATQGLRRASLRLAGLNREVPLEVAGPDRRSVRGEFSVPKEGLTGLAALLVNDRGDASTDNTTYHVELVPDQPPAVELTAPAAERLSVLLRTKPQLAFEARDDFALAQVRLCYEVEKPSVASGNDNSPNQKGAVPLPVPKGTRSLGQGFTFDLSKISPPLAVGDTVRYWLEAEDNNNVTGPGVGQSVKKTLTLLSEEDKRAELLDAMGSKAGDINAIYDSQQQLNNRLDEAIRQKQP